MYMSFIDAVLHVQHHGPNYPHLAHIVLGETYIIYNHTIYSMPKILINPTHG